MASVPPPTILRELLRWGWKEMCGMAMILLGIGGDECKMGASSQSTCPQPKYNLPNNKDISLLSDMFLSLTKFDL